MSHPQQQNYLRSIRDKFPDKFSNCFVLDIGSLDINGNNRGLFQECKYTGIDIGPGNNVDVVCKGHEYRSDQLFDIVISSECFEHDYYYTETLVNAYKLLKPGGLLLFTCATTGRAEHGTTKSDSSWASPHTTTMWGDYYKNLTEEDIREVLPPESLFSQFEFRVDSSSYDLYFYGIKKI